MTGQENMINPLDCITDFIFVSTSIAPADLILVPGGTSPQLMENAAALYHKGMAPYILPSGRYNPKIPQYTSEWEFLKEIGVSLGVPETVIFKEDQACNTFENARLSLDILREKGLNVKRVILSCKAFHARRALLTYQTVFPRDVVFMVSPVPDLQGITRDNWHQREESIKIVMGEVVKIGKYFETEIEGLKNRWIR